MERAGRRADHQATTLPVGLQSRSGRDSERCGTVGFWVGSPTAHGAPMLGHDDETARMGRREGGKSTARNGFTTSGLSCLTTLGGASGSNPGRWPPPRRGREPPPRRPRGRQPTSHDSAGPGQLQGDKTRPPRTSSYIPLFSKYDSCLRWARRQPQVNRRSRRTNGENLHCLEHAYHLTRWMKRGQPESQVVVAVGLGTGPGAGWGSRRRATTKASSSRRLRPTQASKT